MHKTVQDKLDQFRGDLLLGRNNTIVLIEDREDQYFWELILKNFAPNIKPDFPISSTTGKDALRPYAEYAAKDLIICVDSDNDAYHKTQNSDWLNPSRPYIYQTYTHSRESHFIHPENLEEECKEITHRMHHFRNDFHDISKALHPWLILWLFFNDSDNKWVLTAINGLEDALSWKKLKKMVQDAYQNIGFEDTQNMDVAQKLSVELSIQLRDYREYIISQIANEGYEYLITSFHEFEKTQPIQPEETLWYIQGHCAFEHIILPYFDKIIQILSLLNAEIATKDDQKNHWLKKSNSSTSYRDRLSISYRTCLLGSRDCKFFEQIKYDIQKDFI